MYLLTLIIVYVGSPVCLAPGSGVAFVRHAVEDAVSPAPSAPDGVAFPVLLAADGAAAPTRLAPDSVVAFVRHAPENAASPAPLTPDGVAFPVHSTPDNAPAPARLARGSGVASVRHAPEDAVSPAPLSPDGVASPVPAAADGAVAPAPPASAYMNSIAPSLSAPAVDKVTACYQPRHVRHSVLNLEQVGWLPSFSNFRNCIFRHLLRYQENAIYWEGEALNDSHPPDYLQNQCAQRDTKLYI